MVHYFFGMEGCALGQVPDGGATTTAAVRRAIQQSQESQESQESLRSPASRTGINQKTVAKWRKRSSAADLPTGPKEPHSTVLSLEEEALVVAVRKHRLLALDDRLSALQATIPRLNAVFPASLSAAARRLPSA